MKYMSLDNINVVHCLTLWHSKRVSDTAVEGKFTCRIPGDSDSPRGLLILYPSESDE